MVITHEHYGTHYGIEQIHIRSSIHMPLNLYDSVTAYLDPRKSPGRAKEIPFLKGNKNSNAMQCIFIPDSHHQREREKDRSPDLSLILDLVIIVAELLAHVSRHKTTLRGLALGLLDDGHDRGRLGEEHLELLERAAHGLWVEEVHEGHNAGGDDGVDDEVLVADGVDGDRSDLGG